MGAAIRTQKYRLQDHPEWSAYLESRRILDQAIAAGYWVEYEKWTGQYVLVSREKFLDGSPGRTRRRLLELVSIKGEEQAKVRWQFSSDNQR